MGGSIAEGDALTPGDLGSRRVCPSILKTAMTLPSLLAWWYQVWRADALSGLRWALAGYLVNFRRAVLIYMSRGVPAGHGSFVAITDM